MPFLLQNHSVHCCCLCLASPLRANTLEAERWEKRVKDGEEDEKGCGGKVWSKGFPGSGPHDDLVLVLLEAFHHPLLSSG